MSKRSPKEEYIYNELRNAIFARKIPVNTQLNEQSLSKAFDVSRTPIRSVLRRLEREKIVQNIPNKGTYIYQPTLQVIEEVFHFRLLLEKEAVKIASKKATDEQLYALEKQTYQEEKYYINGEYEKGLKLTSDFHYKLIEFVNSDLITEYHQELVNITNIYLVFHETVNRDTPLSPKEHRDIIEAIRSRDVQKAVTTLSNHFHNIGRHLREGKKEDVVDFDEIFKPYKE